MTFLLTSNWLKHPQTYEGPVQSAQVDTASFSTTLIFYTDIIFVIVFSCLLIYNAFDQGVYFCLTSVAWNLELWIILVRTINTDDRYVIKVNLSNFDVQIPAGNYFTFIFWSMPCNGILVFNSYLNSLPASSNACLKN